MEDIVRINEFKQWSLKDKFNFFDNKYFNELEKYDIKEVQQVLNKIVLDSNENSNIRKKALENFVHLVTLQKIKKRAALNLLLDNWEENQDAFLEIKRLKNLSLFYENYSEESQEIEEVYNRLIKHEINEVKSESFFQLGMIFFLKANSMKDKNEFIVCLRKSLEYFKQTETLIENRVDAEFFILTVTNLINIIQGKDGNFEENLIKTANLLWKQRIFSDDGFSPLQVGLYRTLYAFKILKKVKPIDWLDYRKGFNDLCYYFYEIKNQKIKSDLLKNFSDNLIRRAVEPLFVLNFNAELCKIDKRINEVEINSREYNFLQYLKETASDSRNKDLAESNAIVNYLANTFPNISRTRIVNEVKKIGKVHDTISMMHLYDLFSEQSYDNLFDAVISSCIKMQGNKMYKNSTENERNTYLSHLLEMAGFNNKDQTLWGQSHAGKTSGEIDIFINNKSGKPLSIIEALNLDSLKKDYLDNHLEKIFGYDTTGLKYNFILVYSSSKNFFDFCGKYTKHIQKYNYPAPYMNFLEVIEGYDYANIRAFQTSHLKNGKEIFLYHVVVDLS